MTDEEFLKPFQDWFNLPKGDQMTRYIVRWQTTVTADTPEDAALMAWRIMQDRNTTETTVKVVEDATVWTIDTEEIPR